MLCIGVLRQRRPASDSAAGGASVYFQPHVLKELSSEREVRESLWAWELQDMRQLDDDRERHWRMTQQQQQQLQPLLPS